MAKEVKIIWFGYKSSSSGIEERASDGVETTREAEQDIAKHLEDGWVIAGSGGAGAGYGNPTEKAMEFHGFVLLQRG